MIVKNEESVLKQSLESIAPITDEIHITDTGSTDNTVTIAQQFTNHIHHFPWIDDFSAARNASVKYAKGDYILRWDADFILQSGSLNYLKKAKQRHFDNAHIVSALWNIEFGDDGVAIKTIPTSILYTRTGFHWQSPIHNKLVPNNSQLQPRTVHYSDVIIDHMKDPKQKRHRYEQTIQIALKHLTKHPSDTRIRFNLAEAYIREENYEKALSQLNQCLKAHTKHDSFQIIIITALIHCYLALERIEEAHRLATQYVPHHQKHPLFILSYADIVALINPEKALHLYHSYLLHPITPKNVPFLYDYERYVIHPKRMIGYLSVKLNKVQQAKQFLSDVSASTHLTSVRKQAILILDTLQ